MSEKIEQFVHDLELQSAEQAIIVAQVRELYEDAAPDIVEKFIYGGIGFFLKDELIGGVYGNKKHVSIVFSRGNELSDPDKLLEGGGKYRRHIKAFAPDDVTSKTVRFFVEQRVKLGK